MKLYVIISTFCLGLALGSTLVLSKFGTLVCSVLRGHGFWSGCQIHIKAMAVVTIYGAIASMLGLFIRQNRLFGPFTSNFAVHSLFTFGFIFATLSAVPALNFRLEDVGTPFASPVISMYFILALLNYSLIVKLTDYFMVIETFDNPQNSSSFESSLVPILSEYFHAALNFGVPFLAMGLFIFLSLEVSDIGSEWIQPEKRLSNVLIAGQVLLGWFILYSFLGYLKREFVLDRMRRKARSLSKDNDAGELCVQNLDGLFEVGKALNRSANTLTQRNLLLRGFAQFVSGSVVEKVLRNEDVESFSENNRAYVFMIDIRNYTEISQNLSNKDLIQWLNHYFTILIDHFDAHGLILDKFIGDGVLGYTVLGADGDPASMVNQTTRSLIKLFEKVTSLNRKMAAYNLPEISIGVGAQFGEAAIGLVGSKSRRQYTIIGDPVNQASRFEGLCRQLDTDFVVSKTIYDYLLKGTKETFHIHENVSVKGLQEPIDLYVRDEAASFKTAS